MIARLVLPFLFPLAGVAADNLVPDPSFETPAAATAWHSTDGASQLTTDHRHSGRQSLLLRNDGKGEKGAAIHYAGQTGIPVPGVTPGREYVFNVHVKGENVTGVGNGGKPLVVLRWRDASGKKLAEELYDWAPYGTYDFKPRQLHFQAPAGAAKIDLGFRSWWDCLTGVTYWDDVSLVERVVPGRGALLATYEAETAATHTGGRVDDIIPCFTGTGYFDVNTNGAVLEWDEVPGGGERILAVRYSWEGSAKPLELFLNGKSLGRKTPAWTGRRGSYATENWRATLPAGPNTVRLVIQTVGAADKICPTIDRLEIHSAQPE